MATHVINKEQGRKKLNVWDYQIGKNWKKPVKVLWS